MRAAEHVLPKIVADDNLLRAARKSSEGKREQQEVLTFNNHLVGNLLDLKREFLDGSYKSGSYKERYVRVPQTRLIQIAEYRDRVAQQAIYGALCPILEKQAYEHSYACREGKGSDRAAKQLQKWLRLIRRKPDADKWVCGKMDISKFFYRLSHDVIMRVMRKYVADEDALRIIENIIRCRHTPFGLPEGKKCTEVPREERLYDVGVPIGSLMSQTVANMVLGEADQYAKHELHAHFYIRYNDDMIFLAPGLDVLHGWMTKMEIFLLKELNLKCNSKTQVIEIARGIPFVGKRVWADRILPRKSTVKHMKRALRRVAELYTEEIIDLDRALESANSYYAYLGQTSAKGTAEWIENNYVLVRHGMETEAEESMWVSVYDDE